MLLTRLSTNHISFLNKLLHVICKLNLSKISLGKIIKNGAAWLCRPRSVSLSRSSATQRRPVLQYSKKRFRRSTQNSAKIQKNVSVEMSHLKWNSSRCSTSKFRSDSVTLPADDMSVHNTVGCSGVRMLFMRKNNLLADNEAHQQAFGLSVGSDWGVNRQI